MRASIAFAALASLVLAGCPTITFPPASDAGLDAGQRDALAFYDGAWDAAGFPCEPEPGIRVRKGVAPPYECVCPDDERGAFLPPGVVNASILPCAGLPATDVYGACVGVMCPEGAVCIDIANGGGGCVGAEQCVWAYGFYGLPRPESSCAYADLSTANTGRVPNVECTADLRTSGLCGAGCPCPTPDEFCLGNSETHATGICALSGAAGGEVCFPATAEWCAGATRNTCVYPAVIPDWVVHSNAATARSRAGRCVTESSCAALQAAEPGVWRCISPLGAG